jgi:hypothetical protein
MPAEPVASMVMTMEICPNCKREMAIAEVAPVFWPITSRMSSIGAKLVVQK